MSISTPTALADTVTDILAFAAVIAKRSDLRGEHAPSLVWRAVCRSTIDSTSTICNFSGDAATAFRHDCMEMIQSAMEEYTTFFTSTYTAREAFIAEGAPRRKVDICFERRFFDYLGINYEATVAALRKEFDQLT